MAKDNWIKKLLRIFREKVRPIIETALKIKGGYDAGQMLGGAAKNRFKNVREFVPNLEKKTNEYIKDNVIDPTMEKYLSPTIERINKIIGDIQPKIKMLQWVVIIAAICLGILLINSIMINIQLNNIKSVVQQLKK